MAYLVHLSCCQQKAKMPKCEMEIKSGYQSIPLPNPETIERNDTPSECYVRTAVVDKINADVDTAGMLGVIAVASGTGLLAGLSTSMIGSAVLGSAAMYSVIAEFPIAAKIQDQYQHLSPCEQDIVINHVKIAAAKSLGVGGAIVGILAGGTAGTIAVIAGVSLFVGASIVGD
jgi:hypothetical protein